MLFAGGAKGLHLNNEELTLQVVDVVDGDWEGAGVITHNVTNRGIAMMLVDMAIEDGLPVALGVIFDHPRATFDRAVTEQNAKLSEGKRADMQALLSKGQTWTVEKSNTVFD